MGEAWADGSVHGLVIDSKWRGVQGLFTWNGGLGVLNKGQVLGHEWPPVEKVISTLKQGYQLEFLQEIM